MEVVEKDGDMSRDSWMEVREGIKVWTILTHYRERTGNGSRSVSIERGLRPWDHPGNVRVLSSVPARSNLLLVSLRPACFFVLLFGLLGSFAIAFCEGRFAWSGDWNLPGFRQSKEE